MSASIGQALYPADGEGGDVLIRRADASMYRNKLRSTGALVAGANSYRLGQVAN